MKNNVSFFETDQHGEELGMSMPFNLILVDESGDTGPYNKCGSSQYFIMAATVTQSQNSFERIADRYEKNTREGVPQTSNELAYKSSDEKTQRCVLRDIADLRVSIYACVLRKDNLPLEWMGLNSKSLFRRTVSELMREVLKNTEGKISMFFDEQNSYADDNFNQFRDNRFVKSIAYDNADDGRHWMVEIAQKRSIEEKSLQVHDFVVGSIKSRYVYGEREPFHIIESLSKIIEIKK